MQVFRIQCEFSSDLARAADQIRRRRYENKKGRALASGLLTVSRQ